MGRKEIKKVFLISLLLTTIIGMLQISASLLFRSLAFMALGIEFLSDSITTVVAFGGFRVSKKPADKKTPLWSLAGRVSGDLAFCRGSFGLRNQNPFVFDRSS